MEEKIITGIVYNGEEYQIGGGNTEAAFTLTENNGAQMSACTSTGQYAVAEGVSTTASGSYSHAEGAGTKASGDYSHAEGMSTTASGSNSHAEGGSTTASGSCSHAEGIGTTASSVNSHAEGCGTIASGDNSHAEGNGTSATTQAEHASGQFNVSLSGSSTWGDSGNTLFTVGNGYATGSTVTTHNALQIMQDGTIYISDTSGEGEYYQKPMLMLQEIIKDLQNRIATLEANEVTKSEVEKGFNNVITVVDNNKLRIRNNALEDEGTD